MITVEIPAFPVRIKELPVRLSFPPFLHLIVFACSAMSISVLGSGAAHAEQPKLEIVAELDQRPGNIAVSIKNRIFVTMHPFDDPTYKLMELQGGKLVPFPTPYWSQSRSTRDDAGIEAAIGIRAVIRDGLFVMDMGSKKYPPRLIGFRLYDDTIVTDTTFPPHTLTEQSFLQDIAFDWTDNTVYIADMGQADLTKPAKPAIIILYSNFFQTPRRLLEGHHSLMPTVQPMRAEGKDIQVMKDGNPMTVYAGLNPITIDPQREWLYYAPMGPGKIYRVRTSLLKDINLPPETLEASVEVVAEKPASDGMTIDAAGNIYLGNVDKNEIGIIRPGQAYETYIKDERLVWVDGFSFAPDGMIYATVNQLNRAKQLNLGEETATKPYLIVRFKPEVMGAIGR
jgi:sugar lactone lactonase YvrE